VKETVPTGYYYQSQLAPEPCERMRTLMNQSEIDSDPFETSADAIESNGTLIHKYRNYGDHFLPVVKKARTPADISHKRSADVRLSVENLPYVDS
ncbi:hypothetical protein GCK32_020426, partial [Trichostrongylus colubriformis]